MNLENRSGKKFNPLKEYIINEQIDFYKHIIVLLSIYLYEDFVAILYAFEEPKMEYRRMLTNYDAVDFSKKDYRMRFPFEYEINGNRPIGGAEEVFGERTHSSVNSILPNLPFWKHDVQTCFDYNYLPIYKHLSAKFSDLLNGEDIIFQIHYLAFNDKIDDIKKLELYPPSFCTVTRLLNFDFELPLGEYSKKIKFDVENEEDYIIATKLEISPPSGSYEKTRLNLYYNKPQEKRIFGMFTPTYLDDDLTTADNTHLTTLYPQIEFDSTTGLYKCSQLLGRITDEPTTLHKVKLLWIIDTVAQPRNPILVLDI
ncbi:MAG: hypothetical protein FWG64_12205 [Firmicutes bacterium]|nr:hypothetical protein [Bacillota bacterium]